MLVGPREQGLLSDISVVHYACESFGRALPAGSARKSDYVHSSLGADG